MPKPINKKARTLPVLPTGRECGPCSACCTHLDVDDEEIKHEAHVDCPRLVDNRCSDYEARPATCRNYRCLWLEGFGDDVLDRPDQLGVLMHITPEEMTKNVISVVEIREGALDEGTRARATVKEMGFQVPVVTVRLNGKRDAYFPARLIPEEMRDGSEGQQGTRTEG